MKNILLKIMLFCFLATHSYAMDNSEMILQEIKQLRVDMNQRFEQVDKRFEQVDKRFEQVDKRFEQIDKRFEQVDKRFDFLQSILYLLIGFVFASPFIAIYLRDKKEAEDKKNFENLKGIVFVLREMAQDNKKIERSLKAASLL